VVLSQRCKSLFKIDDEHVGVSSLDDHVIHVGFDVLIKLPLEAGLESSLAGGVGVLQLERHGRVAVGADGVMNVVFSWSSSLIAI
jgi:hypothetical protein